MADARTRGMGCAVDLNRLSEQLRAVVDETMQPKSVSLWLKTSHARAPSREGAKE
ncbi:MAG: hypothetical protein LC737_02505 [Chloroflexi bacterium]|nr:hypothetical protein [Chloroflexota bacterium]